MTRAEIETAYEVQNGVIKSPGQFEGEAIYVPYFWDAFLNGMADRDYDDNSLGFMVTPDDKKEFPELKGRRWIKLYQRSDGFICEA